MQNSRLAITALWVWALAVFAMFFVVMNHDTEINQLMDANEKQVEYNVVTSEYVETLHSLLIAHMESGCISTPAEDKLLQQMDLLVSVFRAHGWWDAEGRAVRSSIRAAGFMEEP